MNLRWYSFLSVCMIISTLLSGCIHEELEDCPQGINVRFYNKNECNTDTVYPESIQDINLYLFDKNGILVSKQYAGNVHLQPDYYRTIDARNGTFTIVAWSGLNSEFLDIHTPVEGITTKSDLLFQLKRSADLHAASIGSHTIFYGESPEVYLPDPAKFGTIYENTSINMEEITNRIEVTVEGVADPNAYEVIIESDNGTLNINGSEGEDDPIDYTEPEVVLRERALDAHFTMLKLEEDDKHLLIIKNKENGEIVYEDDLLNAIILRSTEINFSCDHDFHIRLTTDIVNGTYVIMEIWVNDWLVHSYNKPF